MANDKQEYRVSLQIEKVTYDGEGLIVEIEPNPASRVLQVCENEKAAKEFFTNAINRHYD